MKKFCRPLDTTFSNIRFYGFGLFRYRPKVSAKFSVSVSVSGLNQKGGFGRTLKSSKIRLIQGPTYFYFQVTKCTFNNYGPSGTVENKDGLCVLAMNIINEKIYIFLWFWFLTLCVWTGVHLFIRILSMALINFRYVIFGIFFEIL